MPSDLKQLVFSGLPPQQIQWEFQQRRQLIESLAEPEIDSLLQEIPAAGAPEGAEKDFFDAVQVLVLELIAKESGGKSAGGTQWSDSRFESVGQIYKISPADANLRNHLLFWLFSAGEKGQRMWADLITSQPPEHRLGLSVAFSLLIQPAYSPPDWLVDALMQKGTAHLQLAPSIFDTFNYWYREGQLPTHPAAERVQPMLSLLAQLVGQLGKIEEGNMPADATPVSINLMITDSVSLVVSLCHMFGLMEDQQAVPKLHQALALKHRRIQTEAAAALAKLGDETGKDALLQLAEQPVARLRVLNYAEELGILNEVSLEWQGEIATAESHLAIWLADPANVGFAPADIQLLDSREMVWPSYDDPVNCYLFEYKYGLTENAPGNVGICGPLVHAMPADLRGIEVDDMYAAFAGWQTVHQEIFQTTLDQAKQAAAGPIGDLEQRLPTDWDAEKQSIFAGSFFGEWMLVVSGENADQQQGTLILDASDEIWIPAGNENAPVDAEAAWCIVKGRKLLQHFNG